MQYNYDLNKYSVQVISSSFQPPNEKTETEKTVFNVCLYYIKYTRRSINSSVVLISKLLGSIHLYNMYNMMTHIHVYTILYQ